MGPRPSSRGYLVPVEIVYRDVSLQWGRDLVVADTPTLRSVVCAHSALQWGRDLVVADTPVPRWLWKRWYNLQWGRDLVVADTLSRYRSPDGATAPSMGPRPSSRGYRMA